MLVAWWPGVLAIPGALLALLTLCGSLTTLAALWTFWRRGGAAEALRLANETRAQLQALVDAQHETNVDIDRRLQESVAAREALARRYAAQEHELATQRSKIDNLEGARRLQEGRLRRIEAERDWLRARLNRILAWLTTSGIALPDDLAHDSGPTKP